MCNILGELIVYGTISNQIDIYVQNGTILKMATFGPSCLYWGASV